MVQGFHGNGDVTNAAIDFFFRKGSQLIGIHDLPVHAVGDNVWDAKSINGGAPKFSVSLIIPKSDTVTVNKIKAAIQAAYEEGESKLKGNGKFVPALDTIKTPLRDGDKERPGDEA